MTTRAKAAAKSTSPAHYRQPTHSACATLRIVPDSRIFTGLLRDRQSCRDQKWLRGMATLPSWKLLGAGVLAQTNEAYPRAPAHAAIISWIA
jgi:hypothetical protein